jgi:hypothetical protein
LSIAYASPPRLRPASPAVDQHGCGTLGHSVGGIRTLLALLVPTFALPSAPGSLPLPLHRRTGRSPTTRVATRIRGFGAGLSPGGLSAPRHSRPVSYYALFQGWLLLSQPPGCRRAATTLPTESGLGDLSRRSGLFPSRPRNLAPAVSLPRSNAAAFGVWFGLVSGKPPRRSVTLPPPRPPGRRYLNTFRGEPAISGFAWHFTPTHRSSRRFAIRPGSGLHGRVPPASPCPWVAHPVSGRLDATGRPFGLAFAPAPAVPALASPRPTTRRLILQKARRHRITPAPTGQGRTVSGALSLPSAGCFSPFPHGTGSLSVVGGL